MLAPNPPVIDVESRSVSIPVDSGDPKNIQKRFEQQAKAIWSRHHRDRFSVKFTSTAVLQVAPLDLVECVVRDTSGDHFLGGRYMVYSVKQKISKIGIDTTFDLRRRENR